jgi:protein phosphatase
VIASVGNSRVYRLRHAVLTRLTEDHVVKRAGLSSLSREDVAALRPLQLLTRAVGFADSFAPDIVTESLMPEDLFLLCSNGLSDVLERHEIGALLARATCLDEACELLAIRAVEVGADDDVTVLLVRPGAASLIDEAR